MSGSEDLAHRVDEAVARVDGVVRVYSAAPAAVGLVRTILPGDAALSVVRGGDPVEVVVSVGVDADAASSDIARRVADAVRASTGHDAAVHVRVSRVVRRS